MAKSYGLGGDVLSRNKSAKWAADKCCILLSGEISHPTWFSCRDILDSQVVGEYSIGGYRRAKILKPSSDATRKVLK